MSSALEILPSRSLSFHQLLTQFSPAYLEQFCPSMPLRQRQVLYRILRCRTPALGGHLYACPDCDRLAYRYHSCNDRHCPLCGQTDADQWLARQQPRLLFPVPYFLITFTVPEAFRMWMRSHPKLAYDLFFAASSQALQDLALNPKRLGAQLGMLGILHTWSRTLVFHPHIHFLVPAGGLSPDQRSWVPTRKSDYLLCEFALADRCRNLFAKALRAKAPELFAQVSRKVWKQRWRVKSIAAGSGQNALTYLSRYVFKTATANRALQPLPNGQVRWPYRNSSTGKRTHVDLTPTELIRRFLQHVLPPGFCRVRCFGWFHPAAKARANRVRALLGQPPLLSQAQRKTWLPTNEQDLTPVTDPPPTLRTTSTPLCPCCRRAMILVATWKQGRAPPILLPPPTP